MILCKLKVITDVLSYFTPNNILYAIFCNFRIRSITCLIYLTHPETGYKFHVYLSLEFKIMNINF